MFFRHETPTNTLTVKSQPVKGVDSSRVKIICHSGDSVCLGTGVITPAHLTYGEDAKAAADFIVSAIGK